MMLHALERRLLAEELARRRRADERRRYTASQRRGRIDPNPHQIDAVAFALRRIPEGGCILADEVGLGKTIEAGLIIAQLLAEGTDRILLIVPKSLLGQWQTQLYELFGIEAREGRADPEAFAGKGVFLCHPQFAGGLKGSSLLHSADRFGLVVIDEAHEFFSGIYKRFDRDGNYVDVANDAQFADRVRSLVKKTDTPVLLLTATPIQNSLVELWGLVQYVERSAAAPLLGKLPTFRELFCDGHDQSLNTSQAVELRRRLSTVLQRTLRRQAQEFLEVPMAPRRAKIIEYSMSPEERQLYDEVTLWLMNPESCAFEGGHRKLVLIGLMRRMASSLAALSASLAKVAARVRKELERGTGAASMSQSLVDEFITDLEEELPDDDDADSSPEPTVLPPSKERLQKELQLVERFAQRARSLANDSKARSLLDTITTVRKHGSSGEGTGKVVIFTESLTTQEFLRDLLVQHGVPTDQITLFRGHNDSDRASEALARWEAEVGRAIPVEKKPSRDIAVRLALVHEFRERSSILIATEAGAKGLNLQFCETVINYDLPWNPQRIEQRIGRVHRYGQTRPVTVLSFLARDNEVQQLLFEILSRKLDLFGEVLDASDAVLYSPRSSDTESLLTGVGQDFEAKVRRIYEEARSPAEVADALQRLQTELGAKRTAFESEHARASAVIETRLDAAVRQVFRKYRDETPAGLAQLDGDLDKLLQGYLSTIGVRFERRASPERTIYTIEASARLPGGYREGVTVIVGDAREPRDGDSIYLGHPIVTAAIDEARRATAAPLVVEFSSKEDQPKGPLAKLVGRRGRLVVTKVEYRGLEPVDQILKTAMLDGDTEPLDEHTLETLLMLQPRDIANPSKPIGIDARALDDAVEDAVLANQAMMTAADHARFERLAEQLERYVDDQALVLKRRIAAYQGRLADAERRRDAAIGSDARVAADRAVRGNASEIERLDGRLARLEGRDDPDYQRWYEQLQQRRFRQPEVQRILDVEFRIAGGDC